MKFNTPPTTSHIGNATNAIIMQGNIKELVFLHISCTAPVTAAGNLVV